MLFDVDGVLIQPWGFREVLRQDHGITPEQTTSFFRDVFPNCLEGRADLLAVLGPFLADWGWRGSEQSFVDLWLDTDYRPNHQLLALIEELATRVSCYGATNQERYRARYLEERLGSGLPLEGFFCSCDLGVVKPAEGYFRAVLRRLGLKPAEVLLVDDLEVNVQAARNLGMGAELFTSTELLRSALARIPG